MESMNKPLALPFYHPNGFVAAYKQAMQFAGTNGRIASLPDIIDARLATEPGAPAWEKYVTTMSSEYFGYSKGGNKIFIVAHGGGLMKTLKDNLRVYKHEYSDGKRNIKGGRITREEFWELESGKHGDVIIVEYDSLFKNHQYPFFGGHNTHESWTHPLLVARLGGEEKAQAYIKHHARHARLVAEKEHRAAEGVILGAQGDVWYSHPKFDDGLCKAHLLSIGGLCWLNGKDLYCDTNTHNWSDGTRLVGIRGNGIVTNIEEGFENLRSLMLKQEQKVCVGVEHSEEKEQLYLLKDFGDKYYTQYPKMGATVDSGEPKHLVLNKELIGEVVEFKTTIGGYHGFFKYGIKEVMQIAPREANAYYFTSDPQIVYKDGDPEYHTVQIQFCKAEINTAERMLRTEEVMNDLPLLLDLAGIEVPI